MEENDWTARFVDSVKGLFSGIRDKQQWSSQTQPRKGYSFIAFSKSFQGFSVYY